MRNFLSSERHKCSHLDDRVVKKVSKTNFGGITNKAICWGISAMPGISPMVGIWGAPHAPKSDATAIRENARTPIRKTQAVWESPSPISPMVWIWENAQAPGCIWGVPHTSNVRRCRYSGECPNPNQEDASCLGVPKPHISDGVYLGVAQAPGCLWGAPHAPDIIFHFSLFILHSTFLFSCYRTSIGTPWRSSDN